MTWEANLFQCYKRILPRLQSTLPQPFKLQGNTRIENTPAHIAIREAFVNFCVHASYQSDGRLVIIKRPKEIIFSNPGTLLISTDQYYAGSESVCRNPALQTMFSLIGAAEKAGSGSDTIIHGWRKANYRTPYIYEKSQPNKVELILPLESVLSGKVKQELRLVFGESISRLQSNEYITLGLAVSMGRISNSLLQRTLDMHPSDITRMLKSLCGRNFLISDGIGRGMTYCLNKNYVCADDKADDKVDDKVNLIRTLCQFCREWRKATEMARHVGKSPSYLSSHVIPELIRDGLLIKEYDVARHPAQRYRFNPAGMVRKRK